MGSRRSLAVGGARWIAVFALLLFAVCAAPVLADPESPPDAPPGAAAEPPNPEDISKALEEAEQQEKGQEAKEEQELASPEAAQEREASREEFAELSSPDAQELFLSAFAEELKALDADPARAISELEIEKTLGENGAQVLGPEGDIQLVETPIPLKSELPGEGEKPIDLSLEDSGEGFTPQTGLTEIQLPDSLGGSVQIGSELGIAKLPGDASVDAVRLGDKDLFFANTDAATDTFLAPITGGVEVFEQLRSPESPEEFRFELSLPEGATLRSDGQGGAEIVDGSGEPLGAVPAPHAVDAQGSDVPVALALDGHSLVLEVPHRSLDIAYPVLVDPAIAEDWSAWYAGSNWDGLNHWVWQESADYENTLSCTVSSCWGGGLYARSKGSNYFYPASSWGQWVYTAPNSTAFISRALFWPVNGNVTNCPTAHPHGYIGIYNVYSGTYNSLGIYSPVSVANANYDTNWVGANGTRHVIVGIGAGAAPSQLACGHDFYVGGAAIWEDDPEAPTVNSVTGIPSGWVSDTTSFTITGNVSDPGLGVHNIKLTPEGKAEIPRYLGCSGIAKSPCPMSRSEQFNLSGLSFDEGEKGAKLAVKDPTEKASYTEWTMRVDRTPPEVTLSGQLATATNEAGSSEVPAGTGDELSLPVYNLKIEAKDGDKTKAFDKRSGVKNIEIFLDGSKTPEPVPWKPQTCPESSCPMTQVYQLKLNGLAAGLHTLEVIAVDQVGKKRERKIEFEYIPATGMKDEYAMHYFPLPDGQGNEAEEEVPDRPELAVNVMNGNLVYREKDVEVTGYGVDLEVERYYNSLLPEKENTEWGDGWTLAQTPELEPEGGPGVPEEAELVDPSGALEDGVELPTKVGEEQFDPTLQATLTKEAGGYELADETGQTGTAIAFDAQGQAEELRTEGYAKVDYGYEEGDLAEIAVEDPASAPDPSEEELEAEYAPPAPLYQSSFGSMGTASGQFKVPGDVTVDVQGSVWVVDKTNNRLQKFNAAGEFLGKFGSAGSANGQFNQPTAVGTDLAGNLWVVDMGNNRIQKFNANAEFQLKVGTYGTGNAQFASPEGIAIDPKGNIWVADTLNGRLQKFNAKGEFIKAFGSKGSGPGQFGEANSIDFGPGGRFWVTDWVNNRVSEFDEAGQFVKSFGTSGSGPGQFKQPDAVEVDSKGFVWVGDTGNSRIQQFDQSGKYLAQFGTAGTGTGQFSLTDPMGIGADNKGSLWVTDVNNNRVQRWKVPGYRPTYQSAFGSSGSGNGQLSAPADVALDSEGFLWVIDKTNNRIQKFDQSGKYVSQFGSLGSANGQLNRPTSIAIDAAENIWIADSNNNRIQKFNAKGEFILKFGSAGTGNGQFNKPEGVAIDAKGNLLVADTFNGRVQKFSPTGTFLSKFGSLGTGSGQFGEANGIDTGPGGKIWVTDAGNHRVSQFDEAGAFVKKFGFLGPENSNFNRPVAIEVDSKGRVWVGDQNNSRVQQFNEAGEYVTQFGAKGSAAGQFGFTASFGMAIGYNGRIWIADPGNNRIQKWEYEAWETSQPPEENDPSLEVEVSEGLVDSVEGEEAGEHAYEHSGDLLTSHEGPVGETVYAYDGAGRMTKVTLANGTYGSIAYDTTYGRVKSVTVDPAGAEPARTTYFNYVDDPRSTTVTPPTSPVVTYDIGSDGSVLKWWNTAKPPEIEDIAGTLYDKKETTSPIWVGDHELLVQAYSAEGISSILFLANGNQVVDEATCEQDFNKAGTECIKVPNEWITYTGNHPPGILFLEVIVKDRLGAETTRKFWVNIPYTPPPVPGEPVKPSFASVLKFRQGHGLDLDLNPVLDEQEVNNRVFDTIGDWNAGIPIARASMERWGAPLRTPEVAELDDRLADHAQASTAIPAWVAANAPSTYAGYYVDESKGGLIYVGFTANQNAQVASLIANGGLIGADRVAPFPIAPTRTLASLQALQPQVSAAANGYPAGLINSIRIDVPSNTIRVGASNVSQAQSLLQGSFGVGAPISVHLARTGREWKDSRQRISGQIRAGDELMMFYPKKEPNEEPYFGECTAAFGAFERGKNPGTGNSVLRMFALTAGHCAGLEEKMKNIYRRASKTKGAVQKKIGEVSRWGWKDKEDLGLDADAAAIRLENPAQTPRWINQDEHLPGIRVTSVWSPTVGASLCFSGRSSEEKRCGQVISGAEIYYETDNFKQREMCFAALTWGGDSGSPVWVEGTGVAVGILTTGSQDPSEPWWKSEYEAELKKELKEMEVELTPEEFAEMIAEEEERLREEPEACFNLLNAPAGGEGDGTVLGDSYLAPLHLVTATNARP